MQEGRCDIGLASRNLTTEESASGLTETVLAYDGIAVILMALAFCINLAAAVVTGYFAKKNAVQRSEL